MVSEVDGRTFGQCSELCGVGHAVMPIVVESQTGTDFRREHYVILCDIIRCTIREWVLDAFDGEHNIRIPKEWQEPTLEKHVKEKLKESCDRIYSRVDEDGEILVAFERLRRDHKTTSDVGLVWYQEELIVRLIAHAIMEEDKASPAGTGILTNLKKKTV